MKNFIYVSIFVLKLIFWFTPNAIAEECTTSFDSQETENLVSIVNASDLDEIIVYHLFVSMENEERMRSFFSNLRPKDQAKIMKFNMRRLLSANDFNDMQVEFVTRMMNEIETFIFLNVDDPQVSTRIDAILLEAQSLFSDHEVRAIFSTGGVIDTVKKFRMADALANKTSRRVIG